MIKIHLFKKMKIIVFENKRFFSHYFSCYIVYVFINCEIKMKFNIRQRQDFNSVMSRHGSKGLQFFLLFYFDCFILIVVKMFMQQKLYFFLKSFYIKNWSATYLFLSALWSGEMHAMINAIFLTKHSFLRDVLF